MTLSYIGSDGYQTKEVLEAKLNGAIWWTLNIWPGKSLTDLVYDFKRLFPPLLHPRNQIFTRASHVYVKHPVYKLRKMCEIQKKDMYILLTFFIRYLLFCKVDIILNVNYIICLILTILFYVCKSNCVNFIMY